ncbi:hypothetical protein NDU88_000183 [Pleurodeles waltl]|uniref:C2H2-type domain-containing protein n=1 Tax=Pleurodeles waltl TaxID=8319 RepID=A0AAV7VVS4_PLEWA|nr:hypothetical protein NDU88_000183 [Pleurodeles waltl]
MLARVLDDEDSFNAFPVTSEVKQGCLLPPTLFSTIKGATSCKKSRIAEAQKKRELRKFLANSVPTNPADHFCPIYGRAFRACIRLISHSGTHHTQSTSSK